MNKFQETPPQNESGVASQRIKELENKLFDYMIAADPTKTMDVNSLSLLYSDQTATANDKAQIVTILNRVVSEPDRLQNPQTKQAAQVALDQINNQV